MNTDINTLDQQLDDMYELIDIHTKYFQEIQQRIKNIIDLYEDKQYKSNDFEKIMKNNAIKYFVCQIQSGIAHLKTNLDTI